MKTLIVTRHPALVQFLKELGIEGTVLTHVKAEDIKGKDVFGVLPLHLAAEARSVTEVTLDIPADLRGKELTLEEVKKFHKGMTTFVVTKQS